MPTNHLLVKGKVQGVFFRVSAKEKAQSLGLSGWVKNTAEGGVEIVASGDHTALQAFINWCKAGPKGAKVLSLSIIQTTEQAFTKFEIIRE